MNSYFLILGSFLPNFASKWRYKIPCVGVRIKSTRSRCVLSNRLSTSSGRDRLDVFYQLDYQVSRYQMEFSGLLNVG